MLRRTLFAVAVVVAGLVTLGLALRAGAARETDAKNSKAGYAHVVIFHLKPDAPKGAAEAMIADAYSMLRDIPSVRHLEAGPPAAEATPNLAKNDYQVGLVVLFDDAK